jgi:T-complex protein 1 subunit theta
MSDLTLHYLNRHNIAVLKVLSKFELRRLCRVVNATPLARMGPPTPEEMGYVDVFETIEIGGDRVTVLRQLIDGDEGFDPTSKGDRTKTATIVLRGATANRLDDLERAVDDGVNVLKGLIKDGRMVPGAGAVEIELAKRVESYGAGLKGLPQHGVRRFASALECVPRILAENAMGGAEGNEVVSRLWAKHEAGGGEAWGVDVEVRVYLFSPSSRPILTSSAERNRRHPQRVIRQNIRFPCLESVGDSARNRGRRVGAQRRQHHHEQACRGAEDTAAIGELGQ